MKSGEQAFRLGDGNRRLDPRAGGLNPSHGCNMVGQRHALAPRDLLDGPPGVACTRDEPSVVVAGSKALCLPRLLAGERCARRGPERLDNGGIREVGTVRQLGAGQIERRANQNATPSEGDVNGHQLELAKVCLTSA